MLRSTRVVTLLAIAVQVAAFLRTVIIAAALGASLDVDAYNLGLVAPTFISTVIGGWLQVGFVGRYAGFVATDRADAAAAYRTRMLMLVGAVCIILAGLCVGQPERIMALFLQGTAAAAEFAFAAASCISQPHPDASMPQGVTSGYRHSFSRPL